MYKFAVNINEKEHDNFVKNSKYCSLLQSSSWAKVKNNWTHEIVGVYENEQLVASSLVLIKPLPLSMTMMYMPHGPIMDFSNKELVNFFINHLKKWAKKYHCLFIKCDPFIFKNQYEPEHVLTETNKEAVIAIENMENAHAIHLGFPVDMIDTIQPRYQMCVYKAENYRSTLSRHVIRFMKIAQKKYVEVKIGGSELLDDFSKLMILTEKRQNVSLRNADYYQLLCDTYGEDTTISVGYINLKKAIEESELELTKVNEELSKVTEGQAKKKKRLEEEKEILERTYQEYKDLHKDCDYQDVVPTAGLLCVRFGNTVEMLYAGMDERFKKYRPQYLVNIEEIERYFNTGSEWFNLGGVEGTLDDGLSIFKSNFNPLVNEFIGEFDIPVNKYLYQLSHLAYTIRKRKGPKK